MSVLNCLRDSVEGAILHTSKAATQRLGSLDFLRGVAIIGVVAFHLFGMFPCSDEFVAGLAQQGYLGVQLFFLVSAFTMCLMWDRRKGETDPVTRFYIRRILRIAPPFWLAMIFYAVWNAGTISQWSPEGLSLFTIVVTGLFLHTFWATTVNALVPGGWSIGVEVIFYALFPLIYRTKLNSVAYLACAFVIYLFNIFFVQPAYKAALSGFTEPGLLKEFLYFQIFNQIPVFFIGIGLYKFLTCEEWSNARALLGCCMTWLTTAYILKFIWHLNSAPSFWTATAILALCAAFVLSRELSWAPIARLGGCSYSIYLAHFAVVDLVKRLISSRGFEPSALSTYALAALLTFGACFLIGKALAQTVEKWSHNLTLIVLKLISPGAPRLVSNP